MKYPECKGLEFGVTLPSTCSEEFCDKCMRNTIDSLQSKLKDAEEKIYLMEKGESLVDGWISVEDRLPENDDSVLVYDRIEESCVVAYYVDGEWEPDTDCLTASNYDGGAHISLDVYNVTHWQPLPPKPSEEV